MRATHPFLRPNSVNWELDRSTIQYLVAVDWRELADSTTRYSRNCKGFIGRCEGRIIDEFHEIGASLASEIRNARMVSIGTHLFPIVARRSGRGELYRQEVERILFGSETEESTTISFRQISTAGALVRNSVAHCIEHTGDAHAAGKSAHGNSHVRAYPRGNHIHRGSTDDGGGWNQLRALQQAHRTRG